MRVAIVALVSLSTVAALNNGAALIPPRGWQSCKPPSALPFLPPQNTQTHTHTYTRTRAHTTHIHTHAQERNAATLLPDLPTGSPNMR